MEKKKTIEEILRRIYFCGGDKLREEKDIQNALSEIQALIPKKRKIRMIRDTTKEFISIEYPDTEDMGFNKAIDLVYERMGK
jgi:hypothetical protein